MATYTLTVTGGVEFVTEPGLTSAEVDRRIETLRAWFPHIAFTVDVEEQQ